MAQIKDLRRMCDFHSDCSECELCVDDRCTVYDLPDNIDEIVDKWAEEHPAKTYAMDFFEKFPNAAKTDDGLPVCCWSHLYGDEDECHGGCEECWNQEMKGE